MKDWLKYLKTSLTEKRKRVIVNIAPRHGKSELISYLAPAWFLGKHPAKKVIMASHTADLAVNFGRRVRNLVGSVTRIRISFRMWSFTSG
jgi:hypothetical protein